jgi:hypothetical protein
MPRRGALVEDGEHATLTFRRVYRHAPEHVWDAIATPEGLREWLLCTHAVIDGRAGGRIELEPDGDATRVLATYRRITRQTARGSLPGLHAFLDRLEAQLDGRALPDWLARFAELRADYPEWSGHAPDSGE